jgi:hypothetical protein
MTERTDSQKAAEIAAIRALSAPEQTELARLLIANLSNSASDTVKRRFVKGLEPLDQILFLKDLKDEGDSGAVLERTPASDFVAAKDGPSYSPARAAMIAEAEANSPDNGRPHGQKAEPANVLSPERLAMIAEAEALGPPNPMSKIDEALSPRVRTRGMTR